jgi:ribosome-associated protein
MQVDDIKQQALDALEEMKGLDIVALDVRGKASFTDFIIIATGRSDRQVKAMAHSVIDAAKAQGYPPLGVEGEREGEWVVVDLGDVVVHLFIQEKRDFYNLEKLWGSEAPARAQG